MRRVEWLQDVLDVLTQFWLQADSNQRKTITSACHALEKRLARDAENEGESRPDGRHVAFELPISVIFRIEPDGKTITIVDVRLIKRRKK